MKTKTKQPKPKTDKPSWYDEKKPFNGALPPDNYQISN